MLFYAHSAKNLSESQWQTLYNHLSQVGEMTAGFASVFGAQEIARYIGQLHDLGKYTPEFAARLRGGKSVDHATAGAKIAVERWGAAGKLMAFCIAGHHAGLANGDGEGDNRRTLAQRLALSFGKDIPALDHEAERLIDSLRHADQIGGLLRQLQPYTVQIPESALDALLKAGRIEAINEHTFGKQFYSLIGLDLYDEVAGFSWEDVAFLKGGGLVL